MPKRTSKRISTLKKKIVQNDEPEIEIKVNRIEIRELADESPDENETQVNAIATGSVKNRNFNGTNLDVSIEKVRGNYISQDEQFYKENETIKDTYDEDQDNNMKGFGNYLENKVEDSQLNTSESDKDDDAKDDEKDAKSASKRNNQNEEDEKIEVRAIESADNSCASNNSFENEDNAGKYEEEKEDGEISKECTQNTDQSESLEKVRTDSVEKTDDKVSTKDMEDSDSTGVQRTDIVEVGTNEDKGHLLVTWKNKKLKIPCHFDNKKDLNYYTRQLNIIAYPIVLSDLSDPDLSQALTKACEVSLKLEKGVGQKVSKGYLRMKFRIRPHVEFATMALKALPAFEDEEEEDGGGNESFQGDVENSEKGVSGEGVEKDKRGAGGVDEDIKGVGPFVDEDECWDPVEESVPRVSGGNAGVGDTVDVGEEGDEAGAGGVCGSDGVVGGSFESSVVKEDGVVDEKIQDEDRTREKKDELNINKEEDEKNGGKDGGKDESKKEVRKRVINIRRFLDYDTEDATMATVRQKMTPYTFSLSKLLFVANLSADTIEDEILEEFEDCERVIIPWEQNKGRGYAYVEYAKVQDTKKALDKFKESSSKTNEWFVIPAMTETSDYYGMLKEEERKSRMEDLMALQEAVRSEEDEEKKKEIERKMLKHKRMLMADNVKRQKLGFFVCANEIFEGVIDKACENVVGERRPYMGRNFIPGYNSRRFSGYSEVTAPKDSTEYASRQVAGQPDRGFRGMRMPSAVPYRGSSSRGVYRGVKRDYGGLIKPLMETSTHAYVPTPSLRYPSSEYAKSTFPKSSFFKSDYTPSSQTHHSYQKPHYHSSQDRHYADKAPPKVYDSSVRTSSHKSSRHEVSTSSKGPRLVEHLKEIMEYLPSEKVKVISKGMVHTGMPQSRSSNVRGSAGEAYEERRGDYVAKRSRDYPGKDYEYKGARHEGYSPPRKISMVKEYADSRKGSSSRTYEEHSVILSYATSRSHHHKEEKYEEKRKGKRYDEDDEAEDDDRKYRSYYKDRVGKYSERYS